MKRAPLVDMAAWRAAQDRYRRARHGERAKARAALKRDIHDILRRELGMKRRAAR